MSTTGSLISSRVKAPVFTTVMLAAATLAACQPVSLRPSSDQAVHVTRVGAAHYEGTISGAEEAACRQWRLSASQVERFFRLSELYEDSPYREFYQIPCSISGELQAQGRVWEFRINGGATSIWASGEEVRYWGCRDEQCRELVLLATDLMDPDPS